MPPLVTILLTVGAYVAIAVLLISLNLTSRWRWWIKGGAIIVTAGFFVLSYIAITSLLGWPSQARVFSRFELVSSRIVEPDAFTGHPGAIFMWVLELDDNNVPSITPRAFTLAYTEELAEALGEAQGRVNQGEAVQGTIENAGAREGDQPDVDVEVGNVEDQRQGQGGGSNYEAMNFDLIFNDMPAVALPDKGPL